MRKFFVTDRWIEKHAIASWPNIEYGSRGMVVLVDGKDAGIACYDLDYSFGLELQQTPQLEFDAHPPEVSWIWEGTLEEIISAATKNTDLMFPDRKINEQDKDYLEISNLYAEIRKYLKKKQKKKRKKNKLSKGGEFSQVFEMEDEYEE